MQFCDKIKTGPQESVSTNLCSPILSPKAWLHECHFQCAELLLCVIRFRTS